MCGIVPPQVQGFTLLLVESHDIPVLPVIYPVEFSLVGSMTLWHIKHSSQVFLRSLIIQTINENGKKYQIQI